MTSAAPDLATPAPATSAPATSDRSCSALIAALEDLSLPPAAFTHRAHVQAGFAYLQRDGYAGALAAMAQAIRRFAAHHGKATLYHETITVAFLTLIHARMAEDLLALRDGDVAAEIDPLLLDWDSFAANHPDLFAGDLLARYYDKATLASPLARRCFVLPRVQAFSSSSPGEDPVIQVPPRHTRSWKTGLPGQARQ